MFSSADPYGLEAMHVKREESLRSTSLILSRDPDDNNEFDDEEEEEEDDTDVTAADALDSETSDI